MSVPSQPQVSAAIATGHTGQYRFALGALTSLFFMWGFITCLNDILIPYLKGAFELNYTQAMLIQFCFFSAYFVVSVPAGKLVGKIGYQKGIVTGLLTAGIGCVLFYPAAESGIYGVFLFALFVLAAGITVLQVAANPFVSVLGSPETAPARLTMTQAFNSLGTTVAPFFGAMLIFSEGSTVEVGNASATQLPYLMLAAMLASLALIFAFIKLPQLSSTTEEVTTGEIKAWQHKHLVLGAIGIFVYVGAEVAIGSTLVSFLHQPDIGNMTEAQAAKLIAYYWGGAMIGRFIGALVMQKISGRTVLAFNAVCAFALVLIAVFSSGQLALWSILAVGLCNSVMFPTIFSLSLNGLGKQTAQGSGILCLAIVGGAVIPLLQGMLADGINLQLSFLLPALCYIYIAYFGLKGATPQRFKSN
ncbi:MULTISPECIES: sugar MFS transporter [Pseudoalteromonas]|uniref:sugar MFS transporter n=1 Tax=Pseudoalteromonas TaxID=53246 RepID=UPI001BA5216E|nr:MULTISPECIES: sugar MFS transporter [Pseudoalteromonas]MDP4489844.1 sugar MFS transporter [Pseudoalteromonas piscicida]QUI61344.1 glucose/galactose MFS transporter [Pseudoalteromonas sp. A22]QZO14834.1 sugar MFS transporter [Pseudoalteromonas piscicida]